MPKIIADLFGTVFDHSDVDPEEKRAYMDLLREWKRDRVYYPFPRVDFSALKPHPDSAAGLALLKQKGYKLVSASNLPSRITSPISEASGIKWDGLVCGSIVMAYKPALQFYAVICDMMRCDPSEVLFVTANPGSGDDTMPLKIGMQTQVIRREGSCRNIVEMANGLPSALD